MLWGVPQNQLPKLCFKSIIKLNSVGTNSNVNTVDTSSPPNTTLPKPHRSHWLLETRMPMVWAVFRLCPLEPPTRALGSREATAGKGLRLIDDR